MINIKTIVNTY